MGLFDQAKNLLPSVQQTVGTVSNTVNSLKNNGLTSIFNWAGPAGAETGSKTSATTAQFYQGADKDWRVKLSLPKGYEDSQIMSPLKSTGGFVFPFTPQITMQHSASYQTMDPMHNNYPFLSYQNSRVDSMNIVGEFFCEDASDAAYWVAAVHYLRSVSKMVYGSSNVNNGSPPPVVKLNGYGDYVFKNVPVVVTQFSVDLPKDIDYIATALGGSAGGAASSSALGTVDSILQKFGGGPAASQLSSLYKNFANNGSASSASGSAQGVTWVPVKSTVSVTVQPLYSRETVRQFNLDSFVKGDYVKKGSGYL
jgi:hypothetical protein